MTYKVAPIPFPPTNYDPRYFAEVIRVLNLYFRLLGTPGPAVQDNLRLLNLPTSATGLPVGSVWHDTTDNTLKIVPPTASNNIVKVVGVGMTGEAGTVTPSIS